jgi:hypothetical protein
MHIIIFILALIMSAGPAQAGGFATARLDAHPQRLTVVQLGLVTAPVRESEQWSAFGFATANCSWRTEQDGCWATMYGGPQWQPTEWLTLAAGVGLQTVHDSPLHAGGYAVIKQGRFLLVTAVERGPWYRTTVSYAVVPGRLALGLQSQRFRGHGPTLDFMLGTWQMHVAGLWQLGETIRGPVPLMQLDVTRYF